MDSPCRGLFILWICLIGFASCEVTISRVEPVRAGQSVQVTCSAPGKITSCLWEINKVLISPSSTSDLKPLPGLAETQCGVEAIVDEKLSSEWICKVFLEGLSSAQSASTNVTVISVPTMKLRPGAERLEVVVGEEKPLTCLAQDARPTPIIVWKIGNNTLDSKEYTTTSQVGANGKALVNSVLRHDFVAMEYGKELRCVAVADWLNEDDKAEVKALLDVHFAPIPQSPIKRYGHKENKSAEVYVTVQSNPRPHRVFWMLPTDDKLEVEQEPGGKVANNYAGERGTDNGNGSFTYVLHIDSVQARDSSPGLKLQVYTMVGENEASEQYTVHVEPIPAPTEAGLSGGGVAGIILALIALVVIVALVLYSRNTGKLCFAGAIQPADSSDEAEKGEAEETNEACRKPGLGDRLSAVYENICNRSQKKKGERLTATESELQKLDPEQTVHKPETDGVVYAELNLKEATQPGIVRSEEPTEYAEIVGIAKMKENEEKEPEDKESPKPI